MDIKFKIQGKPYATKELPNGHIVDFYRGVLPANAETRAYVLEFQQQVGVPPPPSDIWVIRKDGKNIWGEVSKKESPNQCAARLMENWKTIEERLVA